MEQKSTISLAVDDSKVDKNSLYLVDWTKVSSVNDLMVIIASIGISFSPEHPSWPRIKHLMDFSNPIPLNPQPQQKEIKLPKIKGV